MPIHAPNDPYQALRHPEYRRFLAGATSAFTAMQIQTTVMGWQVWNITHDPLSLGLIGLAEAAPFLALTLLGGHVADIMDRRRLSLLAMGLLSACAAALLALNLGGHALHAAWPFYLIQAAAGVGRAFYRPASQALGTELVPREAFGNAATWRSSTMQVSLLGGPALGGLLYGFGSARVAYGVEACLFAIAVAAMASLAPRPRSAPPVPASLGRSLGEGLDFVFGHKLILSALSLDLFAVLFGGAPAILVIFASDILKVGPQGLGLLRSAPAAGAILTSLALAHWPPRRRAGLTLLGCVGLFGLSWIAFAFSRFFGLSLFLLALSGAADSVSVVLRHTLVQSLTPPAMMGRVQAVNALFIGSSNELGAFESGFAARVLGLVPSVVMGGCMTLGIVGATLWRVPQLRRLRDFHAL